MIDINNFELQSDLNRANLTSLGGDSKTVMNAAKVLNEKIKNHSVEIPWPPKEKDLGSNNVAEYIPELLDIFCTILLSGQALDRDKSKSNRVVRLKNLQTQDTVYSVSNGAIKTPKSVLFPAVVKALCHNTEVVKLINKCGNEVGYNLIEEIETKFALKVISEQTLNRVLIPDECNKPDNPPVALMVADSIDNLECAISGAGTYHRVNSILVLKQEHREGAEDDSGGEVPEEPPAKRKCERSLAGDVVNKETPEYYRGRRVGPGVLPEVQYVGHSSDVQYGNNKDASHALPRLDRTEKTAHSPIAACSWLDRLLHQGPRQYRCYSKHNWIPRHTGLARYRPQDRIRSTLPWM